MKKQLIPEPRPEAFVQDIEDNYTEERYFSVHSRSDKDRKSVTVVSGEYPAYSRFIADIKPYLYAHGFVLAEAKKDHRTYKTSQDVEHGYHLVRGVSIEWVIAESQGYTCNRGACTRLADPDDGWYCEHCIPQHDSHRIEKEHRSMFS